MVYMQSSTPAFVGKFDPFVDSCGGTGPESQKHVEQLNSIIQLFTMAMPMFVLVNQELRKVKMTSH